MDTILDCVMQELILATSSINHRASPIRQPNLPGLDLVETHKLLRELKVFLNLNLTFIQLTITIFQT